MDSDNSQYPKPGAEPFNPDESEIAEAWEGDGIKPIETRWRGYHFRSRAEARWAVFFAALEIAFEYELEGVILPDGTRYLPDFYLPKIGMWAEVKGTGFKPLERLKCRLLCQVSKRPCLLLQGPPDFKLYEGWVPALLPDGADAFICNYMLDIYFHGRHRYDKESRLWVDPVGDFSTSECFSPECQFAVELSRAERFGT
jgi:hypothetical protein